MANINKIKLSGTSYDIQDSNAARSITLTQAEYDGLQNKDPNVFYIISDSNVGYITSAETESAITQAVSVKADTSAVTSVSDSLTAHTANTTVHVTAQDKTNWNNKSDFSGDYNDLTNKPTIPTVPTNVSDFTNDAGYITIDAISGKVDTSTYNTYTAATDGRIAEDEEVTAAALNELNEAVSGKQDTLVSGTNIKTINNTSILGSGNIDIQGGSTYTAGRGISIANDTISFSLPISAGTGTDSVIEGSTNNKAPGTFSHAEGNSTTARGSYSHAEGVSTNAYGFASHSEGFGTIANNQSEYASGQCNVSNKATNTFGDSGNTLFSVGNGTDGNTRHNAFEIRQNGDIYLTKDGQDVKLQDQLGGSSITVDSALSSTSENPVQNKVIYNKIDEVEQVTAAALNELNDNFGGLKLVKLTQAEYNALATKDASTLYIILG